MNRRELALKVLWETWGMPYTWGGDDPSSFDCSGLAIEVLKSVGLLRRGVDMTANGIYDTFAELELPDYHVKPGDLVFFFDEGGGAIHVEMVVSNAEDILYSMGAAGGGPGCTTVEIAWQRNAYVKARPVWSTHPGKKRRYVDPFREVT